MQWNKEYRKQEQMVIRSLKMHYIEMLDKNRVVISIISFSLFHILDSIDLLVCEMGMESQMKSSDWKKGKQLVLLISLRLLLG